MWTIKGDEFNYRHTVEIKAPLPVVYDTVASVDKYDLFLTDVAVAEMQSEGVCHMIVRAGPLRADVRTRVTFEENKRIDFVMIEGPPLERVTGSWVFESKANGETSVTFEAYIKAGRAGKWFLKAASRYLERKGAALIDAFHQQVLEERQQKEVIEKHGLRAVLSNLGGYTLDLLERGGIYLALVLVLVLAAILSPAFFKPSNLFNVLRGASPLGIVAVGQTIVMLGGGIDLSLAGVMALTTVVIADMTQGQNLQLASALSLVFGIGIAVGILNGLLVTKRRVPPFIATLGVAILLEGVRFVYTKAAPSGSIPPLVRFFGNEAIGPVPTNLIIFLLLVAVALFVIHKTAFGRHIYATGANREAARLSGVDVDRVTLLTYVICSVLAVLGGLILAGFIGYADNYLGRGYELDSIAAVVIGGTSFAGGSGGIGGTVVGVLLLTMLFNIVLLLSLPVEYQLIVKGVVIIGAVALYSFRAKLR